MKAIKFLKEDKIELNGVVYKPYKICNLPPSFGMTENLRNDSGQVIQRFSLIDEWFNYKGYTYIIE